MILGIGIDAIEIARFKKWYAYTPQKLGRIFSSEEINYCLAEPAKSAERFAVRFAAKEAAFKALSSAYPHIKLNFISIAPFCEIGKINNVPIITITLPISELRQTHVLVSLTHTKNIACAIVIFQKNILKR